jgi:hypothetical protein
MEKGLLWVLIMILRVLQERPDLIGALGRLAQRMG